MGLQELFRTSLGSRIGSIVHAKQRREELLEEIEELLVLADVSVDVSSTIVRNLARRLPAAAGREEWIRGIREEFLAALATPPHVSLDPLEKEVIVLVGVNGSGKTTTAAKLAALYRRRGRNVLLCAADTFRAAGSMQLRFWGERLSIPVVEGDRGSDPSAVVFQGLQALSGEDHDLLIVDTAGRVQSKEHLMRELEKNVRVIKKRFPLQPRETWLVLDAATGQNALAQAEKFREFSGINGMVLTKMDGTAKGGMVIAIAGRLGIPVRFLGVGEAENDLLEFCAADFVDAVLGT